MAMRYFALLSIIFACCTLPAAAKVTFNSLLDEMTDLQRLTELPEPGYTTAQFSSYDQASTDPKVLTDENWFANHDRGQYLRAEERAGAKEYVLMDAEGPGAIVRIWSANPDDAGVMRIYLDNGEEPVIEMPFTEMLRGEKAPFLKPIAGMRAKGWNNYLPIPYSEHCKVTASKPDFYYHIGYRTYEAGTKVVSFDWTKVLAQAGGIRETARKLAFPGGDLNPRPPASRTVRLIGDDLTPVNNRLSHARYVSTAAPGERCIVASAAGDGGGAIELLTARLKVEGADIGHPAYATALRKTLLEITFDNHYVPHVQAPLGDFFGSMPGVTPYASLPLGVDESGVMTCRWVIPFQSAAIVALRNLGDEPVTVEGELLAATRKWTPESLYFHAKWRAGNAIPTQPRQDWTYLDTTGRGRFVGVAYTIANPVGDWWGEGDEKIYVDGEDFPSTFGTGTEDYFGYAWCDTEIFTHAYHNQPRMDGPGNYGHTTLNRFHILDDIPFKESLRFDMEVWHWADCIIDHAVTAYWYAAPGAKDTFAPLTQENLTGIPDLPPASRVEGAIEGESMGVKQVAGGKVLSQGSAQWGWSGWAQLWWRDAAPGDDIVVEFQAPEAGMHKVYARFTKAPDYGIHRMVINNTPVGKPMDFYHPAVIATEENLIGAFNLAEGPNTLSVTCSGTNPKADPKYYMFGLDYLRLEKVE
jgi:hypothetical protein